MINEKELVAEALEARKHAYVPYSKYQVGAALITKSGKLYKGCNIESAAYSVTTCAERTALLKAVSEDEREFEAIAIVGGDESENDILSEFAPPCGVCRQYLREFCNPKEFKVILAKSVDEYNIYTLEDLLPLSFGPEHLK